MSVLKVGTEGWEMAKRMTKLEKEELEQRIAELEFDLEEEREMGHRRKPHYGKTS